LRPGIAKANYTQNVSSFYSKGSKLQIFHVNITFHR